MLPVLGFISSPRYAESVAAAGNYVYAAAKVSHKLEVVDVSDPTAPSLVGSVHDTDKLDRASGVAVQGSYAYVSAESGNRVTIVDVSSPSNASIVGSVYDQYLALAKGIAAWSLRGTPVLSWVLGYVLLMCWFWGPIGANKEKEGGKVEASPLEGKP